MSEEYLGGLVEKYGNSVLRLAYTYLKNLPDAEDVVQELFLKMMESRPIFNDEEHEKRWIMKTAVNMCRNELKSFRRKNVDYMDDINEISCYDTYASDSDVLRAVISLPEKYRLVIHLYYYEEYSTAEIAGMLSKNTVTVRSLLHRAREKLKTILKEDYDFE